MYKHKLFRHINFNIDFLDVEKLTFVQSKATTIDNYLGHFARIITYNPSSFNFRTKKIKSSQQNCFSPLFPIFPPTLVT